VEWPVQLAKAKNTPDFGKKKLEFLTMPPNNATAFIRIKPGWMDHRVVLNDRLTELKFLSSLASALESENAPWDEEIDSFSIVDSVVQLITTFKGKPETDQEHPRDFIDLLWEILKNNRSATNLQMSLQKIYDELRTGEFQVMVESNKASSLARILRMRNTDEMVLPRLEPLTCLQMMVEIGIDSFNAEIAFQFLKDGLVSNRVDLEPYLVHFAAPIEDRIAQLFPLHLALQSMKMLEKFVCFSPYGKIAMTKKLLGHFNSAKDDKPYSKVFSLEVAMEDIYKDKLRCKMSEWLLERTYDKSSERGRVTQQHSGSIQETILIARSIGFKHVVPVECTRETNESPAPTKIEVKPNETAGSELSNQKEPNLDEYYDCVHLMAHTTPSSLFAAKQG